MRGRHSPVRVFVMSDRTEIQSAIPARLDALPWSRWHWRVVIALGVSWLLDGLEVTVVGSLGPCVAAARHPWTVAADVGWSGSAYIGGAVLGALYFGRLADRLGRKRLFIMTLAVYLAATILTAFTFDFTSLRCAAR
jgi:MFS family permease